MIDKFTDGNEFLESFIKDKSTIFLTSCTYLFSELAYNWYLSLKNINAEDSALVVAHDKISYLKLQKWGVPSVLLEFKIPNKFSGKEWIEIEKHTKLISLFYLYKKFDINIVFSDIDIVFLKNPIKKFIEILSKDWFHIICMSDKVFFPFHLNRQIGKEILLNSDFSDTINYGKLPQHAFEYQINAGFCFLPSIKLLRSFDYNSFKIKNDILEFLKKYQNPFFHLNNALQNKESDCLQAKTNYHFKTCRAKLHILDCFEFVNGSLWKIFYLKQYAKNICYIVHYNFSDYLNPKLSLKDKVNRIKSDGFWYV